MKATLSHSENPGGGETVKLVLSTQTFVSRKLIHDIIIAHSFISGQLQSNSSVKFQWLTLTQIDFYLISEF